MIIQCIFGMIPFLTLLFLFVLTFALVHMSLDREDGGNVRPYAELFITQYQVLFGENASYDITSRLFVRWLLYFVFTILMCVVMLNLLISIISDEYDKVQATQRSTDLKAKCEVIYDFGQIELFFLKNILCHEIIEGETMYVHRFIEAQASDHDDNDGQWLGRVKVMTEKQNKIIDDLAEFRSEMDTKLENMLEQVNESMDIRMDGMEQKLENIEAMLIKQEKAAEKKAATQKLQSKLGQ